VTTTSTVLTLAASAVLLAAFAAIERRTATPLVRLGILRNPSLVRANLGALMLIASFVGFQFVTVLYLQEQRGWSETETGLALMVMGIDTVLAPTVTPWLVHRFGNPPVIGAGFALGAAAYGVFLGVDANWGFVAMLPSLLLIGLMFALVYGPLTIAATTGVDDHEQGLASGILTTSFQFGAALGLAVAAAVLTATEFRTALAVPLVIALLGIAVTAPGFRRARARR
jgi:predicted MFS family arabinose efflux permease